VQASNQRHAPTQSSNKNAPMRQAPSQSQKQTQGPSQKQAPPERHAPSQKQAPQRHAPSQKQAPQKQAPAAKKDVFTKMDEAASKQVRHNQISIVTETAKGLKEHGKVGAVKALGAALVGSRVQGAVQHVTGMNPTTSTSKAMPTTFGEYTVQIAKGAWNGMCDDAGVCIVSGLVLGPPTMGECFTMAAVTGAANTAHELGLFERPMAIAVESFRMIGEGVDLDSR